MRKKIFSGAGKEKTWDVDANWSANFDPMVVHVKEDMETKKYLLLIKHAKNTIKSVVQ